eukprot:TRINITY_DN2868_c0_g1_i1.p1 TRINITY_DN2868_c0_g1~~TRINITY_DN2868_c0_g1_i1.p1  ORF type:complete len:119 (-),score=29.02 TRINITY_DN2868_c0_g1_i1:38-394(-)
MVVVDPFADRKAIVEASYMNIPVIALCNTDNSLEFVDVAIPTSTKTTDAISMIFWLLAREVLVLKGQLMLGEPWDVPVELFYYKDLDDMAKADKFKAAETGNEVANNNEAADWDNDAN